MILNSNHLEPKKRNLLLNTIKSLANLLILEDKKMETTLVTFSTESNSDIFTALKYSYIYNNLDKGRSYDINLNNFYLIKSDSSGVGKSRHIRNLPWLFESNMLYLPLGIVWQGKVFIKDCIIEWKN